MMTAHRWGALFAGMMGLMAVAQSQQHIHLYGVMPTVDVGMPIGEGWCVENYSFA